MTQAINSKPCSANRPCWKVRTRSAISCCTQPSSASSTPSACLNGSTPATRSTNSGRRSAIRAPAGLIQGGLPKAVEIYLRDICDHEYAEALISKYHNGGTKGRNEVMAVLAESGITLAVLYAKAAQLEGSGLAMFDRMVAARESGRRLLRKEAARGRSEPDDTPAQ
jgi:hypothetical protein